MSFVTYIIFIFVEDFESFLLQLLLARQVVLCRYIVSKKSLMLKFRAKPLLHV